MLAPSLTTNASVLTHYLVTTELEPNEAMKAPNNDVSTKVSMEIMDHYEVEALMRFTALGFKNGLSSKADTLIDKVTSLNCVSKGWVTATKFYKDCKTILSYLFEELVSIVSL